VLVEVSPIRLLEVESLHFRDFLQLLAQITTLEGAFPITQGTLKPLHLILQVRILDSDVDG